MDSDESMEPSVRGKREVPPWIRSMMGWAM